MRHCKERCCCYLINRCRCVLRKRPVFQSCNFKFKTYLSSFACLLKLYCSCVPAHNLHATFHSLTLHHHHHHLLHFSNLSPIWFYTTRTLTLLICPFESYFVDSLYWIFMLHHHVHCTHCWQSSHHQSALQTLLHVCIHIDRIQVSICSHPHHLNVN